MKKFTIYILILITLVGFSSPVVQVNAQSTTSYQLLAPLPQLCPNGSSATDKCTVPTTNGLGAYLNPMIKIFIALCAVLSVIMIVVGGIEYMTSELAHSKEAGKERIMQAILGLLIALGSWALLNTINPDLLNSEFNPGAVNATVPSQSSGGTCNYPELTTKETCEEKDGEWTPTPAVTPAITTDEQIEYSENFPVKNN